MTFFTGGTIDITVHEVIESDFVTEIVEPTGGPWGGANVNAAFWTLLERAFHRGSEVFRRLKEEEPKLWWEIQMRFEHSKRMAKPQNNFNTNIFTVGVKLLKFYKKITGKEFEDSIDKQYSRDIEVNEDYCLSISQKSMSSLFSHAVTKIEECVRKLLQKPELREVKYMLMVGGFSQSPYLREAMQRSFSKNVKILIPQDPALAVMKGAVLFGKNPDSIRCRMAKKTYGVSTVVNFNTLLHRPNKKFTVEGVDKCKDIFHVFIKKGSSVAIGDCITEEFAPKTTDAKSISFDLLACNSSHVTYTDDRGVQKVGYIEIPLGDKSRGKDRRALVTMMFGLTEIRVTVKDTVTGETKKYKINNK